MNIIITGHKGFIGKNLYKHFENTNNNLKGIDESYLNSTNWKPELLNTLYNFQPNVIFHVGACSNTLESDVNYMMTRNYESTKVIVEFCKSNNVKLIYSSSAANYGIDGKYPSNLYGWSKYAAEELVNDNGVSLRYFNVYGPGEENKGKMSSVAYQMYIKYKNSESIKLFPGKPSRDFVYIRDVIDANIKAMENYYAIDKAYYDVGSGESRTFEDVLNIMEIEYSYTSESDIPYGYQFKTLANEKLFLPNWRPKYNIELGLNEYKNYLEK